LIPPHGATWRSGYATVCKTVYTSSILVVASILSIICSQFLRNNINLVRGIYEAAVARFRIAKSKDRHGFCPKLRSTGGPKHAWKFRPAEGADRGSFNRAFSSKLGRRTYPAAAVILDLAS
jgi:hypothetical protein